MWASGSVTLGKLTLCFVLHSIGFLTCKMRIIVAIPSFQGVCSFGVEVSKVLQARPFT